LGAETDARVRALLDTLDEGIVFQDRDGRIVFSNRAAHRILARTAEELAGRTSHDPEWQAALEDGTPAPGDTHPAVTALRTGEAQHDVIMQVARGDGTTVWVSVNARPIWERDAAAPSAVVISFSDVTDDVRVRRELEHGERRLSALLERSSDVVLLVDTEGRLLYVSPSAPGLFGYPLGSNLGRNTFELVHPDDRERARDAFAARLVTTERREPLELRVLHADGSYRDVEVLSTNLVHDPAVRGIVLNVRDVTERKQAQLVVLESEARLNALLHYATDMTAISDAGGVLQYVSPAVERTLGLEPAEWVGRHVLDAVHPDDCEWVGASFDDTVAVPGPNVPLELRVLHADGSYRHVEVIANNLLDEPCVRGIVFNARDVTERRRNELALRTAELERERHAAAAEYHRLQVELERAQRLESVGRLAGGVAHDFNNLLGVILNYARFIESQLECDSPILADVLHVRRAAEQAAELTNKLLVFGRVDIGRREELDLDEIVAEVAQLLGRSFGAGISLVTNSARDPMRVSADRGQIEQVLMNLLVNARDALGESGTITMTTARERVATADGAAADRVVLTLTDDGVGMAPDVVDRVFEPFFTTKPVGQGTGLGLATAHRIVSSLGGEIEVRSEQGRGTTVRVVLPASEARGVRDAGSRSNGVGDGHGDGHTVLVVDDDVGTRALTCRILSEAGYRVVEAESGEEALRRFSPDVSLVLTDVVMPEISGYELARRLRRQHPDLPIRYVSGHAVEMAPDADVGVRALSKPFDADSLLATVRNALAPPEDAPTALRM
jgi:hypothetical protein